jgi:hypothetical protein
VGQEKLRENQPLEAESTGKPAGPRSIRPKSPEMPMHTDAPTLKVGGRLSREDQRRLGDILQRVYDDVVRQGVPDRFKALLGELDHPEDEPGPPRQGSPAANPQTDPVIGARGLGGNKGSPQ